MGRRLINVVAALAMVGTVVSRGVVDFGRSVVIVSDSIGGVRQDASSRLLPPSTSLVGPSSGARSSRAMEPSAR